MKYTFILLLVLFSMTVKSQSDVVIPLSSPNKVGYLEVDLHFGSIIVIGEERSNVVVRYDLEDDEDAGYSHNGLKRIGKPKAGLEITEDNNNVRIEGSNHNELEIYILVPFNFNINIKSHNGDDLEVKNIIGEVSIESHNSDVEATNIQGTINASSYNGDVTVDFKNVSATNDMIFNSYNGDIEITLPENTNCEFKLKSQNGDLLSDLDMEELSKDSEETRSDDGTFKLYTDSWTYTKLNNGGPELKIISRNGDIILRKRE